MLLLLLLMMLLLVLSEGCCELLLQLQGSAIQEGSAGAVIVGVFFVAVQISATGRRCRP